MTRAFAASLIDIRLTFSPEDLGKLLQSNNLLGVPLGGYDLERGLPDPTYAGLQAWLQSPKRACLFVDRDGVLIEDTGYPRDIGQVHFNPAVLPLLQWVKKRGWIVLVISNQAGIAKGIFEWTTLHAVNRHIAAYLSRHDARPEKWYYCPYHPQGQIARYAKSSLLRKPSPGMILAAMHDYKIDIAKSFMIGDKDSDVITLAGLQSLLIKGKYPINPHRAPCFNRFEGMIEYLSSRGPSPI